MSAFLIYFICSFLFIIFYITRDEIRRARDKRSGALVKRLPRTEPWVWSIYIPLVGGMNIYMFTHLAEFQTIVVIFAVIGLLFGLIGMYYYETKYLRFNPDNTITYRGLTGKLRTTPSTNTNTPQNPTVPTTTAPTPTASGSGTTKATPSPPTPHAA
ncbi:Uncharacterised protein [Rothia dentocariosa]|uniref:Uncharacterized protein n=2 Tax=Rothia dentocariosa TaxID=2047 RepID=A0A448UY84_9MICC|nr:Uncharacterised protein [Rothia dentocariosa]